MAMGWLWPAVLLACLLHTAGGAEERDLRYTRLRRMELRDSVKEMFMHAWNGYKQHAFPADELRPLTCTKNDHFGGYALTVIDSLDTLVMLGEIDEFQRMVAWLQDNINFQNLNRKVSVFETNIRVMGGLLSGHVAAVNILPDVYTGGLLRLAKELGEKLLPAFDTPTGIPYNEVNLMTGVDHRSGHATCPAAAGTLLLEFGMLGVLLEDCRYVEAAYRAIEGIWKFRSNNNLVGTIFDIFNGKWAQADADIGASHDSFFEYMLKSYVMFNDKKWLDVWKTAYFAAQKHLQGDGNLYVKVDHITGTKREASVNSLQAFWPGLLVGYGDIEAAVLAFRPFELLFDRYYMLPEDVKLQTGAMGGTGYPLRPEMVESAWLLHRATGDPHYLHFGERLMYRLNRTARTRCGFAAVRDVRTKQLEDKMDSYMLSETLKYLLLLFDPDPNYFFDLNSPNFVLTTEAHPLPIQASLARQYHKCFPFDDKSDLTYTKKSPTFFPDDFKLHEDHHYEKPHLRWWEKKDLCPKPIHYMRIAGLMREKGRCINMDYVNSVSVARSSQQVYSADEAGDRKDSLRNLHFELGNPYREGDMKSFEMVIPSVRPVEVMGFTGGVVLQGLQHDWLNSDTNTGVVTLYSPTGTAAHKRDVARELLLCTIRLAADMVQGEAARQGVVVGKSVTARRRSAGNHRAETPADREALAGEACRAAVAEVSTTSAVAEEKVKRIFHSAIPKDHALYFKTRMQNIASHTLCEEAVRTAFRETAASGSPTEVDKAVLSATLSLDQLAEGGAAPGVPPVNPDDEAQLLSDTEWPQATDIRGDHTCQASALPPHVAVIGSKATFGAPLPLEPSPYAFTQPAEGNALACTKFSPEEAARLAGTIVIVERGECTFHRKALHVEEARGAAMVVINSKSVPPNLMGGYPGDAPIAIPLMMLSKREGVTLLKMLEAEPGMQGSLSRNPSAGQIDLRYSGVMTAASPLGTVLWRLPRPAPSFVSVEAVVPALSASYHHYLARLFGAEDIADDVEAEAVFSFPREQSAVVVSALGTALPVASEQAQGWHFTHVTLPDPGAATAPVGFHPTAVAWHIAGYETALGGGEAVSMSSTGASEEATLARFTGTVARLYHQPVKVTGSAVVLCWMALQDGEALDVFYVKMDILQQAMEEKPGYYARELIVLDEPAQHASRGVAYTWLDVSQWRTASAASEFIAAGHDTVHALTGGAYTWSVVSLTEGQHADTMPQHPLVGHCDTTSCAGVP